MFKVDLNRSYQTIRESTSRWGAVWSGRKSIWCWHGQLSKEGANRGVKFHVICLHTAANRGMKSSKSKQFCAEGETCRLGADKHEVQVEESFNDIAQPGTQNRVFVGMPVSCPPDKTVAKKSVQSLRLLWKTLLCRLGDFCTPQNFYPLSTKT